MNNKVVGDQIRKLIELSGGNLEHEDLISEMISTVLRLSTDHSARGDVKIIHQALKEIRYGFKLFSPYQNRKKISIFGSARSNPAEPIYGQAAEFSRKIATKGFMVITGAGEGIMRAAQDGAGPGNSFGVNIMLPFEQGANEFIENDPKLMTFKYFFARKLFFVKEANAIALFPGGFGTHDEAFEALTLLQTGKTDPLPLVLIDVPGGGYWESWRLYLENAFLSRELISEEDMDLFKVTDDIGAAVDEIVSFYHNYHSIRFVRDRMVVRLNHPVQREMLDHLNDHFSGICLEGKITSTEALREEMDEPDLVGMPRIVFCFNRKSFGRLRKMIDVINTFPVKERVAS
ncbi:MAG: LOG family protein [Nitrospiria bacterium]